MPLSIEIAAELTAPVIAVNDTIRVEHGHDAEDKVLTQRLGLWGHQFLDKTIQHVVALRLAGMNPRSKYDCALLNVVFQES